jgi:hypothetical protein
MVMQACPLNAVPMPLWLRLVDEVRAPVNRCLDRNAISRQKSGAWLQRKGRDAEQ